MRDVSKLSLAARPSGTSAAESVRVPSKKTRRLAHSPPAALEVQDGGAPIGPERSAVPAVPPESQGLLPHLLGCCWRPHAHSDPAHIAHRLWTSRLGCSLRTRTSASVTVRGPVALLRSHERPCHVSIRRSAVFAIALCPAGVLNNVSRSFSIVIQQLTPELRDAVRAACVPSESQPAEFEAAADVDPPGAPPLPASSRCASFTSCSEAWTPSRTTWLSPRRVGRQRTQPADDRTQRGPPSAAARGAGRPPAQQTAASETPRLPGALTLSRRSSAGDQGPAAPRLLPEHRQAGLPHDGAPREPSPAPLLTPPSAGASTPHSSPAPSSPHAPKSPQDCGVGEYKKLMLEFRRVVAAFNALKAPYRAAIADITMRMGDGMADFIEKEARADTRADSPGYLSAGTSSPLRTDKPPPTRPAPRIHPFTFFSLQ